ncbi:MAG: hypothetical protein P8Z70_02875 [Desulfuromonadales bacterium]
MATHQFVTDALRDVGKVEVTPFLEKSSLEHNLEQQVAELVPYGGRFSPIDGLKDFVGLL